MKGPKFTYSSPASVVLIILSVFGTFV